MHQTVYDQERQNFSNNNYYQKTEFEETFTHPSPIPQVGHCRNKYRICKYRNFFANEF